MQFSATNAGIVEQTRFLMKVDSNQWSTAKIVNSCNNWLDFITGYAIGADRHFQWDDTNHSALPIGTTNLVANQQTYSFLTDEQGNRILTLTRVDLLETTGGDYKQLKKIDQTDIDVALDEYESTAGIPTYYDLIADNIIKLYPKPSASITAGLKLYFQRSGSYFATTDTTKEPGVALPLHRGFVIASAYDGALTLGLKNLNALAAEREKEEQKVVKYFSIRNMDEKRKMTPYRTNTR